MFLTAMWSSVLGFVTGKARLVIEYAMIAGLVSLAAITYTLWLQNGSISEDLTKVKGQVVGLEITNATQDQTIDNLKTLRAKDANVLDGLIGDYKALATESKVASNKLKKLEQTNAEVRAYINQPLPLALKCLLNNTCKADDHNRIPNPTENPNPTVPASK